MRDLNSGGGGGRQWRSSANIMDLNLGKRRSGGGMSSSADHMASEVTRTAAASSAGGGGGASQQSYELIKSTQVGAEKYASKLHIL